MCETCGCTGEGAVVRPLSKGEHVHVYEDGRVVSHSHHHDHHEHDDHDHPHVHAHAELREPVQVQVLARNRELAAHNRTLLHERRVSAINLMSSPGAGKTTLLAQTLPELQQNGPVAVIEGDQATSLDADRIARTGVPVVQINTGKGCHLEADMIFSAVQHLAPAPSTLLIIENVGNLVCPALFDLGEAKRIVLLSVTEGEDKPDKYPNMFAVADLVVLTKIDLLPHVDFDVARARRAAWQLNPEMEWLELSAKTGAGIPAWLAWLDAQRYMHRTP
jgi:hydrogenase nickel incorporation protein HypB